MCVSLLILSGAGEEEGRAGLQLGRCEYKARTASAENILHETESQQEQSAPVGMECTMHRAAGKLSTMRLNLSLQHTQGIVNPVVSHQTAEKTNPLGRAGRCCKQEMR